MIDAGSKVSISTAPNSDDNDETEEIRRVRALAVIENERQMKRDAKLNTLNASQRNLVQQMMNNSQLRIQEVSEKSDSDGQRYIERRSTGRGSGRSRSRGGNGSAGGSRSNLDHKVTKEYKNETTDLPNDQQTRSAQQSMEENFTEGKPILS